MKKMAFRYLAGICAAALAVGALAGCGASAPAASATGQDAASGTAALELFSTKGENVATLQKLADAFTAQNPGITIEVNSPADAGTVLRSRLTKNDLPDLMFIGGDATYTELVAGGVLTDLSGEDFAANVQDSYKQMMYDITPDKAQALYAIPYATNASGVLYNKDLFAKAGVTVPATWTEFTAAIGKLKAAGINPIEFTFTDSWTTLPAWNSMAPVIPSADFTAKRAAGETTFVGTHEEVLQKYLTLLDACQNDYMGTGYDDGNKAFAEGQAAMMIQGNWAIPEFLKSNPQLNVDMFAFPSTDDAAKNTVTSGVDVAMAVSAASPRQAEAKKFLAFMADPQNAQSYVDEQFAFSAIKGAEQSNATVAGVKAAIAAGKVSNFPDHYYPAGFDLAAILSQFALNAHDGMDAQTNIQQTLAECDTQYDAVNVA